MIMPRAQGPVAPGRTDRRLRSFYRLHAPIYDQTRWAFLFGRAKAIDSLNLRPGNSALEVGCGTGLNFALLRSAVGPDGFVIGIDCSEQMLARAQRRIARLGWSNVAVRQASVPPLDLEICFDAVLFSYSLTMIECWEQALARAARLLKPGGTLGVLDFGQFRSWPWPAGPIIQGWLRLNQVHTPRPVARHMGECLDDVHCHSKLGGYYFIATGRGR
ncbi:MAG: methyltransferase domain-containing protein [Phycisphaerales bacterium]|nr:MAG: methyltransferase domain-containing protein [Phycisphaerales bacterium]